MNIFSMSKQFFSNRIAWFKKASWWKKTLAVIALIIVILIVTSPLRSNKGSIYTTEPVTRGNVADIISETGNAAASQQINVYSPSTGIMEELYVKDGDQVVVGQNLFRVKSTATAQEKATAYASYAQAKNSLDNANAALFSTQSTMYGAWKKFTDLATNSTYQNSDGTPQTSNRVLTDFTTTQDNWLAAEANYKDQQGAVTAAQAALNSASLALQATQDMTVTAQAAGTIGNLSAKIGDNVNATTVSPVLIIGNLSNMTISIAINEVDRPLIHVGQKATISFSALKGKTFTGNVLAVDNYGTNSSGVITYQVSVSVDTPSEDLHPAMTANVDIEAQLHENVLTVPNTAIKPYNGGKAIQVIDAAGKPKFIPVSIGLKGIDRTEIVSGVNVGTKVITGTVKKASTGTLLGGG